MPPVSLLTVDFKERKRGELGSMLREGQGQLL